jgi:hypothetical protein
MQIKNTVLEIAKHKHQFAKQCGGPNNAEIQISKLLYFLFVV